MRRGDELSPRCSHVGRDGDRRGLGAQAGVEIYLDAEQSRATAVGKACRASGRIDDRGVIVSGRHERSRGCTRRREHVGCGG
jgi:hypothetical protein